MNNQTTIDKDEAKNLREQILKLQIENDNLRNEASKKEIKNENPTNR